MVATRVVRAVIGGFGAVVITVSLMFIVMAIGDLVTGDTDTRPSVLVALIALFGGAAFWGFHLARTSFGWTLPFRRRRSAADKEQAVLSYAAAVGGRVTVVEVAGHCHLSLEESKRLLDQLAVAGVAELLVADDGTVVYDFNLLSPAEKARARELT